VPVAAEPPVEAAILARERQRDVDAAVARLRDKLRDVVLLRYSAGLSYEQIAVTLEIPTGTVKRRLFDAMERLRQSLEER
jgi:RNA polymerase sigma-70 factor (ECF subfamily)